MNGFTTESTNNNTDTKLIFKHGQNRYKYEKVCEKKLNKITINDSKVTELNKTLNILKNNKIPELKTDI
jgi:membrane-bound lytic murein transglycosylase MltF